MISRQIGHKTEPVSVPAKTRPIRFLLVTAMVIGVATVAVSQNPPQPVGGATPTVGVSGLPGVDAVARVGAAGDMIGFSHSDASGTQTITLVHTGKSWMAVYHIDKSGKIRLISSRPIDADFSLQLNATSPLPNEIREIGRR